MALELDTPLKDALATTINSHCSAGAGTAQFRFLTSGEALVAAIDLQETVFSTPTEGTITLLGTPLQDDDAAGGRIAAFAIHNRDGVRQMRGKVLTAGGDVNIEDLEVLPGETVELQNFSVTVP